MDADCTVICFHRFVVAQLHRRPWAELSCRPNFVEVHNFLPIEFEIPLYVLSFLSKGGKYIPDRHAHHPADLVAALQSLGRQLDVVELFAGKCVAGKNKTSKRCALSAGTPLPRKPVHDLYLHRLQSDFECYVPLQSRRSLSFFDRRALHWLKSHSSTIAVIDVDKNLGDGIFLKSWVDSTCESLLLEACSVVPEDVYLRRVNVAHEELQHILDDAALGRAIPPAEDRWLRQALGSSKAGSFRIRPKIHKNPISARPVANLSGCWIQPIAKWLCEYLAPIVPSCSSVVDSADRVISMLGALDRVPDNYVAATTDVTNLYPCIDQQHLLFIVSQKVRHHYRHRPALAQLICRLIGLVLRNQYVCWKGKLYHFLKGIATGLATGVFLANIYLSVSDDEILAFKRSCCPSLLLFARFVDDAFAIIHQDDLAALVVRLNSWHHSIVWSITASGRRHIPFLDLLVSIEDSCCITWELFRKPLHKYLYVPRNSCHPPSVFQGLIVGESLRILRRCQKLAAADKHLSLFAMHLVNRGYSRAEIEAGIVKARRIASRPRFQGSCGSSLPVRKIYLKVKHSCSVNYPYIKRILARTSPMLASEKCMIKPMISRSVQHNVFRQLYPLVWRR